MSLPWVRLDSNIASHDKMLSLLSDPSATRWQAFTSYVCALGYAGGHGTDGHIPAAALGFIHGSKATAKLLVKYGLWDESPIGGWSIRNFAQRQELAAVTAGKRASAQVAGRKAACTRWHERGCECWRNAS